MCSLRIDVATALLICSPVLHAMVRKDASHVSAENMANIVEATAADV